MGQMVTLFGSAAIAAFVNVAQSCASGKARSQISQRDVAGRFGHVGFLVADRDGRLAGLLGWQVENLVVCVIGFLIASALDPIVVGRALVAKMEAEGEELLAEAVAEHGPNGQGVMIKRLRDDITHRPV